MQDSIIAISVTIYQHAFYHHQLSQSVVYFFTSLKICISNMIMNTNKYFKSIPGKLKILTTMFGIIILVLGLRSHLASDWVTEYPNICKSDKVKCFPLSFEQFFVSMIVTSCAFNVITMVGYILTKEVLMMVIIFDIITQCLLAFLLLISGTIYTASAIRMNQLVSDHTVNGTTQRLDLKIDEKIYAGVMTIIQGLIYIATALCSVCWILNERLQAEFSFPRL